MKALIDGDVIIYQAGFSSEERVYNILSPEGEDLGEFKYKKDVDEFLSMAEDDDKYEVNKTSKPQHKKVAISNAKRMIDKILEATKANEYTVYITGDGNYRDEIATIKPYKGNRTVGKPYHYDTIKDYLINTHNAELQPYQEADDAMSIEQWRDINEYRDTCEGSKSLIRQVDGEFLQTCICTIDKDLNMVPGWHYNWNKDEMYFISEWEGILFFYTQLLTGDMVDNIQGVPGVGRKKAVKMLSDCEDESELLSVCREAYSNDDALIENAQLLWMRTEDGEMWSIPSETNKTKN